MNQTGKYATPEEVEEVTGMVAHAQISGMTAARFGPQRHDDLMHEAHRRVHELALAHGLPDVPGFYGLDATGQFVSAAAATPH